MSTFYIEAFQNEDQAPVVITGEDANHIMKSQRKTVGDLLTLSDGKGLVAEGKIIQLRKDSVVLELQGPPIADDREPQVFVTLYQGMPKGDKAEMIIQKAVELGVGEIQFFLSSFCTSRPDQKSFDKKLIRYNKIALEAAKQCGRGRIPVVKGLLSYKEMVEDCQDTTTVVLYEKSSQSFRDTLKQADGRLNLVVGSEGGFSVEEIQEVLSSGGHTATLGKRILRCETAPLAALSGVMFYFEEF